MSGGTSMDRPAYRDFDAAAPSLRRARPNIFARSLRAKRVNKPGHKSAAAAAHGWNPNDGFGFAVLHPPVRNSRDQSLVIRRGRRLFAGELSGCNFVAGLSKGDDLTMQLLRRESFRHVLSQRPPKQLHPIQGNRTPIAAVRCSREEIKLSAALLPLRLAGM